MITAEEGEGWGGGVLSVHRLPAIDVWCHYLQIGYELEQWPF